MQPFRLAVPQAELDDLRERLARTRLPAHPAGEGWSAGVDAAELARLVAYWREGFDWRGAEARLAETPQFTIELDGQLVHFAWLRAERAPGAPEPRAIVLGHGWPYSYFEMLRLAHRLARPAEAGDEAFDVVVPSLPGFGFSAPFAEGPFVSTRVAELWHALMTRLGYEHYFSYGEDVGTSASDQLAARHPEAVVGLFATHAAFPPEERSGELGEAELAFRRFLDEKWTGEHGYAQIQSTKPDTLAVGLTDSPAGLLAWLLEKFRTWSDGEAQFRAAWSDDDILTTVSVYWFSGCIGTSFRAYSDDRHETPLPEIDVPVGVAVQHGERGFPREYAARSYRDIRVWHDLPSGGHFTAHQSPELVAAEFRAFAALIG